MEVAKNDLPAQSSSFLGRDTEIAELTQLLHDPACRLLTLIGPGGVGKSRLALEAARTLAHASPERSSDIFADGICFVPLQPIVAVADTLTTISILGMFNLCETVFDAVDRCQNVSGEVKDEFSIRHKWLRDLCGV